MSKNVAEKLRELAPAIIQRWEDRVRAEIEASSGQVQVVLRNSLALMLEVVGKVLSEETDPKTAACDTGYMTTHAAERADQPSYSLEDMILECQVLQEVVLEMLEAACVVDTPDRTIILRYFRELVRSAAGEYARIQTERLAKLSRAKDEFLAMLGHELRNPLGAIYSSLILLREGARRGKLPERALDVAERQAGHMKQMLDDLLDVARVTEGKVVLRTEPLDLGALVQETVEAARTLFDTRQHSLTLLQEARVYVNADPVRLAQCVSNLLSNAAKYTHSGGKIEVTVERDEQSAIVRVRDSGIGIPRHLLPTIFELFQQASRSLDRSEGGLGIGLTVVHRLMELHGGSVEVKSDGPGKGSEFSLWLPSLEALPEQHRASEVVATNTGLRILLVEDNQDSRDMMSRLLQMLGHRVVVAEDGPTALAVVGSHNPDLALVDIGLPGMSGYELAAKLRSSGHCSRTMKLVALTGYAANLESLATAGFDRHIAKPLDFNQLERLLASVVPVKDR